MDQKKLTRALLEANLITEEQVEKALSHSTGKKHIPLETLLVDLAFVKESDMASVMAPLLGVELVDVSDFTPTEQLLLLVPRHVPINHSVIPIAMDGKTLTLAMADPLDLATQDLVRSLTGYPVKPVMAAKSQIEQAIGRIYKPDDSRSRALAAITEEIPGAKGDAELMELFDKEVDEDASAAEANKAPVIKLVNAIIVDAIDSRASDIHMEPNENGLRVRYRLDGLLRDIVTLPPAIVKAVTSRVKLMGSIDISEHRKPQDGRASVRTKGRMIDLRMSSLPTFYGEKMVLRILDKEKVMLDLEVLGFSAADKAHYAQFLEQAQGMIIITGPTGSGKTSTLYASLNHINRPDVNIVTVEDPVEFQLPGINQVQINNKAGVTFAKALRAILRQDPNVVMVGEIRDGETALIAAQASMTGHLVFSTVHTNDAPSTISRLVHMGLEPYLVSASLISVMAQRLVRRLCANCREEMEASETALAKLRLLLPSSEIPEVFYRASGCEKCNFRGYSGRLGIYEILTVTEQMRDAIHEGLSPADLGRLGRQQGMRTLLEDGMLKVSQGLTSLEEVMRVSPMEMRGRKPSSTWQMPQEEGAAAAPMFHVPQALHVPHVLQPPVVAHPPHVPSEIPPPAPVPMRQPPESNPPSAAPPTAPPAVPRRPAPEGPPGTRTVRRLRERSYAATKPGGEVEPASGVLLVETDPVVCELLREVLTHCQYRVTVADSGQKALEALERGWRPDLVILDSVLAAADSGPLVERVRGKSPLLVLTSRGRDSDGLKGDDYLPKPVDLATLVERVESLLAAKA